MTLDIERERREIAQFNEWVEREEGSASTEEKCSMFTGWLAAKRAAVGSAEPFGWVNAGTLQQAEYATLNVGGKNPWKETANAFPVFTAPPAPVSAEPVTGWFRDSSGEIVSLSAPPSKDAKDSERYKYLKRTTTAIRDHNTGERIECTPEEFEASIDRSIAIDAAIAAKEAGK